LLIAVTLCPAIHAQGGVTVESKVDRSKIFIGDVVRYSLVITRDADVQVTLPPPAANLGQFEIRDYKVQEPRKEGKKIIVEADYFISTFDIGDYEIPPLEISYRAGADTTLRQLKTEPIKIAVQSLNPSETGDIKDIKPPLTPPFDYKRLILIVAGAAVVLAALIGLFWHVRRRRSGRSLLPKRQAPARPAHEVALEALQVLIASDWLKAGRIKEYHSELADILRRYIQDRYFIEAMEMTSDELIGDMEVQNLDAAAIERLRGILQPCDLVKFAKFVPPEEQINRITAEAFGFVEQTKLVLIEPPPPENTDLPVVTGPVAAAEVN